MIRHLEGGQIIKLTVHKNKKTWHFHFKLRNVLPYQIFERFHSQLTRTFSHIAQVTCSIEAENPSIDEQLVQDYWTRCIQELDGISPPILALLNDQKPKLTGNKILLKTKTDTEASALKRNTARSSSQATAHSAFLSSSWTQKFLYQIKRFRNSESKNGRRSREGPSGFNRNGEAG